jgi:hypothetical protein
MSGMISTELPRLSFGARRDLSLPEAAILAMQGASAHVEVIIRPNSGDRPLEPIVHRREP